MRILFFVSQFHDLGGAERLAVEAAIELNRRPGICADVLGMYSPRLPGISEAAEALRRAGIPSVELLGLDLSPGLLGTLRGMWRLRHFLEERAYDVVETSMVGPTILASWARKGLKSRLVGGIHAAFQPGCPAGMTPGKAKAWRFSAKHGVHAFYAISRYAGTAWSDFSNTPPERTRVIYNSVHPDCFTAQPDREGVRRELGIPEDGRIVLCVGRLMKEKGIETALEALGPVLAGLNAWLLFVGSVEPGEADLIQGMQKRIETEGWQERVRFLWKRSDCPRLMASADALVCPTRWEGFGLVLAEAMATGLPIVASNVDAVPEVLAGTPAIMVDRDDVEGFRREVVGVLGWGEAQARSNAEIARQKAQGYRTERRADDLIRLFEDVIKKR